MKRPLIHIGYHKTGSSWLQTKYFPKSPGWCYLDRHVFSKWIINVHPLEFSVSRARSFVDEWLATVPDGVVPAVSHERLSGYPHSGGYDSKEIMSRLAAVLPEARILIVIREQRSMLFSGYRQYVMDGGPCTLSEYLNPRRTGDSRVPPFRPEHYAYDRLVNLYQCAFGKENVLVLPFEMFRAGPSNFVEKIEHFAEVGGPSSQNFEEVNLGRPMVAVLGVRRVNRIFHRNDLNPAPLIDSPRAADFGRRVVLYLGRRAPRALSKPIERLYRARLDAFARGRYADSNARTSVLTGLDLAQWGYEQASNL